MQVNNSANSVYSTQGTQVQPLARSAPNERASSVQPSNATQDNQPERIERIESSDSAIAQLEQSLQSTGFGSELGAELRNNQPSTNQQNANQQTSYDQPSQRNNTALSAYQSVDNLEQRESVQQLLGVDVYA